MMDDSMELALLKIDLQRMGANLGDEAYLNLLLGASKTNLTRQGIKEVTEDDYIQLVVGTASWMYRKRISGEGEPAYLRRLRHDLLISQKMGGM